MNFSYGYKHIIADYIAQNKLESLKLYLMDLEPKIEGVNNKIEIKRFLNFLETGKPVYSIFAENGNVKLPFVSFSALPGKSFCPGAGACLEFCYSFNSWRYAGAFFRQCQNTILLNTTEGRVFIRDALLAIVRDNTTGLPLDLRLYVDGDFRHSDDVVFWFALLHQVRDGIKAYGYSKSFQAILSAIDHGAIMPTNYLLNISGGHNATEGLVNAIKALPFARGEFVAVSIGKKK